MLTPTELDRRPEGPATLGGGASTVAVERTSALPVTEPVAPAGPQAGTGRPVPPVALPMDHTPTAPPVRAGREVAEVDQDDRRGPWRWVWAALGVALIAGVAAWWFVAGPGSPTVVPPTAKLTYEQAAQALETAHLSPERLDQFDETVPKGVVMSTDPGAGTEVRRGTDVTVTVSKGPERYAVPNVVNKSKAEASEQIVANKLVVGTAKDDFSETVAPGLVISVDPKVGTQLKRGAKVNLVVSKGRQPIEVTDWTGKPADEAIKDLTGKGLEVDATKQENSDTVPKGSVISQSPAGGTLYKGDKVTLVVSKGPVMVKVPDVTGKQAGEARTILEGAGFKVEEERALGGIFGTVHHTNPAANTEAPKGSVVTMVIV
jgi:serine/threonine-protein kinase